MLPAIFRQSSHLALSRRFDIEADGNAVYDLDSTVFRNLDRDSLAI